MSRKAFSCSDLPAVKQIVVKSSINEMDGRSTAIFTKDNGSGMVNKDNFGDMKDCSINRTSNNGAKWVTIGTQTLGDDIMSSNNTAIKDTLLKSVSILRNELQELSAATSSWDDSMKKYLLEQLTILEGIRVKKRARLLTAKNDSDSVKELTKINETLNKKISGLNSENESLRKEIETKELIFSEKELRYHNDLERQKQYTTELESSRETFESEQQIRFNSAIGRVMKEKEAALKKAEEQLNSLKLSQEKNDEKLQVLFNEKETLRQEKDECARKLVEALEEINKRKTEMENYIMETQKRLDEKERRFTECLENERKEAAAILEAEKVKLETELSGSG